MMNAAIAMLPDGNRNIASNANAAIASRRVRACDWIAVGGTAPAVDAGAGVDGAMRMKGSVASETTVSAASDRNSAWVQYTGTSPGSRITPRPPSPTSTRSNTPHARSGDSATATNEQLPPKPVPPTNTGHERPQASPN